MTVVIQRARSMANRLSWLPPLLARITVGFVFAQSGWGKLHHLDKVIGYFTDLGIPFPVFQAYLVAASELLFGSWVIVGFLTRLAVLPLIVVMAVALATAKASEITGVTDLFGISEFLYTVLLFWLFVNGPGILSLDWIIARKIGLRSND